MKRLVIIIALSCVSSFFLMGQENKRVDVFVYSNETIATPLNALRAELTHELVNHSDSSVVVNDRSDEILSFLRQELNYQESGMVREDQLVKIGEHFGANYLCVVNVTRYQEYNQYFFECNLVNISSRTIVKHSYYPQSGVTVSQLDPQTQITIGRDLANQLGIKATTPKAATASATVVIRQTRSRISDDASNTAKNMLETITLGNMYSGAALMKRLMADNT